MKNLINYFLQHILCVLRAVSHNLERNAIVIGFLSLCHLHSDSDPNRIVVIFGDNSNTDSTHDHRKYRRSYVLVAYSIKRSFSRQFSSGMVTKWHTYNCILTTNHTNLYYLCICTYLNNV